MTEDRVAQTKTEVKRLKRLISTITSQWRSQDIANARAQHGHTTFVRTSVRGAEAFRGVWGLLPQNSASQVGSEAIP